MNKELKDILTARRCLNHTMHSCENNDCLNLSCPLNKEYNQDYTKRKDE